MHNISSSTYSKQNFWSRRQTNYLSITIESNLETLIDKSLTSLQTGAASLAAGENMGMLSAEMSSSLHGQRRERERQTERVKERERDRQSQRETYNSRTQTGKSPSPYRKGGDSKEEESQVYMMRKRIRKRRCKEEIYNKEIDLSVVAFRTRQKTTIQRTAQQQHDTTKQNTTRHNTTQHNTTQHNKRQHNTT